MPYRLFDHKPFAHASKPKPRLCKPSVSSPSVTVSPNMSSKSSAAALLPGSAAPSEASALIAQLYVHETAAPRTEIAGSIRAGSTRGQRNGALTM
eukprot:12447-Heterococcus_DN1.PRE.1